MRGGGVLACIVRKSTRSSLFLNLKDLQNGKKRINLKYDNIMMIIICIVCV